MKKLVLSALAVLLLATLSPLIVSSGADAAVSDEIKTGACQATGGGNCDTGQAETKVNNTVSTVINIFSWIIGVVSVIMIIYGGFLYVTSGGNAEKTKIGRNTILYAIIGLVIVMLAQTIVFFVLKNVE